jgi:hypothetical protein
MRRGQAHTDAHTRTMAIECDALLVSHDEWTQAMAAASPAALPSRCWPAGRLAASPPPLHSVSTSRDCRHWANEAIRRECGQRGSISQKPLTLPAPGCSSRTVSSAEARGEAAALPAEVSGGWITAQAGCHVAALPSSHSTCGPGRHSLMELTVVLACDIARDHSPPPLHTSALSTVSFHSLRCN